VLKVWAASGRTARILDTALDDKLTGRIIISEHKSHQPLSSTLPFCFCLSCCFEFENTLLNTFPPFFCNLIADHGTQKRARAEHSLFHPETIPSIWNSALCQPTNTFHSFED
jgi:hypothetical protein